jgi:hypothetical protein
MKAENIFTQGTPYEIVMTYLMISIILSVFGAGALSIDYLINV